MVIKKCIFRRYYKYDNDIGFVKPEHRLLKILSNISSGSKIKLKEIVINLLIIKILLQKI